MKLFFPVLAVLLCFSAAYAAPVSVVYPSDHPRFAEYIEILRAALDRTVSSDGPYAMKCLGVPMEESRYFFTAETTHDVNVVWGAATEERERKLIAIRIPLSKGLLGYRIGLIHSDLQPRFDAVKELRDLKPFTFGLGFGWGEVSIYTNAGFRVVQNRYEHIFRLINEGGIDYFSRGIGEIWGEFGMYSKDNPRISIERSILLHSRYPYYFFVSPGDKNLAARIEKGMRMMIADGSFDRIFWKHNGEAIAKSRMNRRRIIEIPNPDLPSDTPSDPSLWYRPR